MPKQSIHRAILPQPASPPSTDGDGDGEFQPNSVQAPAKRGRKPGPLSRAARETQRKLNHSIIEKARRTKINDALTTLKQLVPAGYGQSSPTPDEDEEGKKKKGKKEDKEKEFKLEILERTVVFLQDLLKRVQVLEADGCAKCSSQPKRKRSLDISIEPSPKRSRLHTSPRLPSISSWLPVAAHIDIDPQLLNTQLSSTAGPSTTTGLPSPPASTHFAPQQHALLSSSVPTLNLGASASSTHSPRLSRAPASGNPLSSLLSEPHRTPVLSPLRTPEDESAASLLLQIRARGSALLSDDGQAMVSRVSQASRANVHAQTPGSILGLDWNKEDRV